MSKDAETLPVWVGWARLAAGLAQGVCLHLLHVFEPASMTPLHAALVMVAWTLPVLVIGGLGALRPATLGVWALAAAAMVASLAWHEVARLGGDDSTSRSGPVIALLTIPVLLFIGHHLVAAGDEARRWIAPYERYFDLGWRHGAQLLLALLFTGAFWAVLGLGAAMFNMIGLSFLRELIQQTWFSLPATSVVFAAAIHLTDLRSGLVRGARALGLVLLSWLLPAMTGLAAAFFVALPFTGLEPLWATRAATAILLSAAGMLVVLINAAYQDGLNAPNPVLRWAARIAAVLMTPLALLAAYALYLRIAQYGLTPERIYAAALLLIGACYAVSYAIGAFSKRWMKALEIGNLISAGAVIVIAMALFSPLADPARLSVNDQMARLASGRISAEQLDLDFLRFHAARYGKQALARLRDDTSTPERQALAELAARALAASSPYETREAASDAPVINMRPAGAAAPADFVGPDTDSRLIGACTRESPCAGYLADLNRDGAAEVLIRTDAQTLSAFAKQQSGRWALMGEFLIAPESAEALERGDIRAAPALVDDLIVGNRRTPFRRAYTEEVWPEAAPGDDGRAPGR